MRGLASFASLGFCSCLHLLGCADDGGTASGQPTTAAATTSPGCQSASLSPGVIDATLEFGGKSRQYALYVPANYTGQASALVFSMHGFMSNYTEQQTLAGMSELADREGFLVVYPNGAGATMLAWNAGDCCEYTETDRDDVGFISALIDEVGESACVDLQRVYATGFSNGGFLSHRLACELSDRAAAITTVAGVLGIPEQSCNPERAVPVLQFHGSADLVVPYPGGQPAGWEMTFPDVPPPTFRAAAATRDFWASRNGCTAPAAPGYAMGDVACEAHSGCNGDARVELCTIDGGGHTWPGGDHSTLGGPLNALIAPFFGVVSTSIDASEHMWQFLRAHTL
jgi:polyhydroxybutyrate depolymerase